mgnify:CR=1 FL=1
MLLVMMFTACDDDLSKNPTLQSPSTFKLNTPSYAATNVNLATAKSKKIIPRIIPKTVTKRVKIIPNQFLSTLQDEINISDTSLFQIKNSTRVDGNIKLSALSGGIYYHQGFL